MCNCTRTNKDQIPCFAIPFLLAAEPIACSPTHLFSACRKGSPGIKMARDLGSHFFSSRAHTGRAELGRNTLTSSSLQGNSLKPTHFLESPHPTRYRAPTIQIHASSTVPLFHIGRVTSPLTFLERPVVTPKISPLEISGYLSGQVIICYAK